MKLDKSNLTIYIIGRDTAKITLKNISIFLKFYPELSECIVYVDDDSKDSSLEVMQENGIKTLSKPICNEDLFSYKYIESFVFSVRNTIKIKQALQDCKTKYAIIMHPDMFVLNDKIVYEMFEKIQTGMPIVAINKLDELNDFEQYQKRVDVVINDILNSSEYTQKEKCMLLDRIQIYLEAAKKHNSLNKIWTGFCFYDLDYFKRNNYYFCDRDDFEFKNLIGLAIDSQEDFLCYLDENKIPFLSLGMEKDFYHVGSLCITRTLNIQPCYTELKNNREYYSIVHPEKFFIQKLSAEELNKIKQICSILNITLDDFVTDLFSY